MDGDDDPAMTDPAPLEPSPPSRVGLAAVLVGAAVFVAKAGFAASTPLFPDEAFYWQCAQRLGLAYSDHPALNPLWIRAGTELLGHHPLGVRLVGLLASAAVLPLVFWTALPAVGRRRAWGAVGVAALLPGLSLMGALAIPDAPLLFATALAVLAFSRALDSGGLGWWLLAGLGAALGLASEYRIFPFLLAMAVVLVATPEGRRALRSPGPWVLAGVAFLGFLPTLLFNLEHDFAPIRYQLVGRHDGDAPGPLKHVGQQALVATPLLYATLLATLGSLLARARRGDEVAWRFGLLALVPLLFWLAVSPVNDDRHTDLHWPIPAYLPLLPFVPGVLARFAARGRAARVLAWAVPVSAGLVLGAVLVAPFAPQTRASVLKVFLGWEPLAVDLAGRLDAHNAEPPLVVFDHYVTAGQVEFGLARRAPEAWARTDWYVLDHRLNRNHGRSLQYELWGRGEAALRARAGAAAWVLVEPSRSKRYERGPWRLHLESLVAALEPDGSFVFGGEPPIRHVEYHRGRVTGGGERSPAGKR